MNPLAAVSGAIGVAGGIANIIGAGAANKKLQALMLSDPQYSANPIAQQRLGLTQTLLNARAPGAAFQEANIYNNQANTMASVDRNATSGADALAVAAGVQGQTNQAFTNQAQQDAEDYQRRLNNVVGAQEGVIQEGDKVFQDKTRRFGDQVQIQGAQQANTSNAWKSLSNLGFAGLNFGMSQQKGKA